MTALLPLPEVSDLPADLQEALSRVFETARKYSDTEVHALRAALNIALSYVPSVIQVTEQPEVVVMWADEDIDWVDETWASNWEVVEAGEVYLVCPVCCGGGVFVSFADGTEYADLGVELLTDGSVLLRQSGYDFTGDGTYGLSHQSNACYARLSMPAWLYLE